MAALAFVAHWGNFIEPLLYLFDPAKVTLPMGLSSAHGARPDRLPGLLAGALVATLPPVLVFALAQRAIPRDTRRAGWVGR